MLHQLRLALNGRMPPFAKEGYLRLRQLNAGQRALPDFLIIGAMKAGTTSLFNYLCMHPQVVGSVPKEIFYFCSHPERGERWYRRHFPLRSRLDAENAICGEATPSYLSAASAPRAVAQLIPKVKLIALLRDPTERAISHYAHRFRAGREPRGVNDFFSASMIDRIARAMPEGETETLLFDRGYYARGLTTWLKHFPKEQLLAIEAEHLFEKPQSVFDEVCGFLGLQQFSLGSTESFNASGPGKMRPELISTLRAAYAKQNRELADLGYSFSWMA